MCAAAVIHGNIPKFAPLALSNAAGTLKIFAGTKIHLASFFSLSLFVRAFSLLSSPDPGAMGKIGRAEKRKKRLSGLCS